MKQRLKIELSVWHSRKSLVSRQNKTSGIFYRTVNIRLWRKFIHFKFCHVYFYQAIVKKEIYRGKHIPSTSVLISLNLCFLLSLNYADVTFLRKKKHTPPYPHRTKQNKQSYVYQFQFRFLKNLWKWHYWTILIACIHIPLGKWTNRIGVCLLFQVISFKEREIKLEACLLTFVS